VQTWTSIIEHISRRYGGLSQIEVGETAREIQKKHQRQLDELLGKYALENLKHQVHLLKGEAGRLIPELANQLGIQLIVMGTVCRTGVAGFFIDNTGAGQIDAVLYPQPSYHVDCSVLAVKPDGFVTPVTLEES
ncbi:MAG: universal stress protein, partial [Candidatus Poribacteria bacterium]